MLAQFIADFGPGFIAAVVPVLVALYKRALPDLPTWLTPIIAVVLGPTVEFGLGWLASVPATGVKGALAGLAGIGVRELYDQIKQARVAQG